MSELDLNTKQQLADIKIREFEGKLKIATEDLALLRGKVNALSEEQKKQGGALNAIVGNINNILPRLNVLETPRVVPVKTKNPWQFWK